MIKYLGTPNREEPVKLPSKSQVGIFGILLIIALALSIKNYDSFQLGTYMDDSSYVVLAQSIALSDDYGLINVPGQPQPTRYPFGFPLLLSPFAELFPDNPNLMKLASLLATLLNASLLFVGWPYLSQNKSYWWGLIIAALYLTSPLVVSHTRMVMSEPAFTTFILAALILTEKYLSKDGNKPTKSLILGGIAAFALFIRTLGIALWIAIVIRVLLTLPINKSLKILGYMFGGGIAVVLIVIILTPVAIPDLVPVEYVDQFQDPISWGQTQIETSLVPRFLSAFTEYTKQHLRDTITPVGGGKRELEFGKRLGVDNLPLLTGLFIGILILLGSFSFLSKQGVSPTVYLFEILYFGAILLWPWRGERFLYPLQPFLYYHFLLGILLVIGQIERLKLFSRNASRLISHICVGAVILTTLIFSIYKGFTDNTSSLEYTRDLRVGAIWLRENASNDAVIMAQQPQSIYLYSQRKTIDYPRVANATELERLIHEQGVDYILVAPKLEWRADGSLAYDEYTLDVLLPFLNTLTEKELLRLVYESEKDMTKVYQVINSQ
jgi:hypothetical protein